MPKKMMGTILGKIGGEPIVHGIAGGECGSDKRKGGGVAGENYEVPGYYIT